MSTLSILEATVRTVGVCLLTILALAVLPADGSVDFKVTSDPPKALSLLARWDDVLFQPVLDYDKDSCYNVPAIDGAGTVDRGLPSDWLYGSHVTEGCRDAKDLDNQNVYVRVRCNNGWCVHMYDHYFEKDPVEGAANGHTYDWEHIAIWSTYRERLPSTNLPVKKYFSIANHGEWSVFTIGDPLVENKVVYHRDGGLTHTFRVAGIGEVPENHKGQWIRGAIVEWDLMPSSLRNKLSNYNYNEANFALKDANFAQRIKASKPSSVRIFDENSDDPACVALRKERGFC